MVHYVLLRVSQTEISYMRLHPFCMRLYVKCSYKFLFGPGMRLICFLNEKWVLLKPKSQSFAHCNFGLPDQAL